MARNAFIALLLVSVLGAFAAGERPAALPPDSPTVQVSSPMVPPDWAIKERLLLVENTRACKAFFERYFDKRGWLKCAARWSIVDGVDDSPENVGNWPLLYALGADPIVLEMHNKAWDAHVKQYSGKVEYAPDYGCIYHEFVTANDAFHSGEHYSSFNQMPVADPRGRKFTDRMLRFAGFYLNEGLRKGDEPIWDPNLRIVRSAIHGSRGAQMSITPQFWGHLWDEIGKRDSMSQWTNVQGDDVENLYMTTFVANAFMVSGQEKYEAWVRDYVDAWIARADANSGTFPSNVGLSGKPGEHRDGKWWKRWPGDWRLSGGIRVGLENAMMLTGDVPKYMAPLRRQLAVLLEHPTEENGKMYPASEYGDNGWSGKGRFGRHALRLYLSEFRDDDLKLIEDEIARYGTPGQFNYGTGYFYHVDDLAWLYFVLGRNPEFPQRMIASDLARLRERMQKMRNDKSEDWKRRNDEPTHGIQPCSTHSLVNLACGGIGPLWKEGTLIFAEVWPYDPARNRPGLPEDVGALVDSITKDEVAVQLVNLCQSEPRTIVIRMGAYGEHQCLQVVHGGKPLDVNRNWFAVKLDPGCGARLALKVKRFANRPQAGMPWE